MKERNSQGDIALPGRQFGFSNAGRGTAWPPNAAVVLSIHTSHVFLVWHSYSYLLQRSLVSFVTIQRQTRPYKLNAHTDDSPGHFVSRFLGFGDEERANFKNILIQNLLLGAKTLAAIAEENGSELLTDKKLVKVRLGIVFGPPFSFFYFICL